MAVAIVVLLALPLAAVLTVLALTSRRTWGEQGHIARVPVDDFVIGDLPMVCARTGVEADGLVAVSSRTTAFEPWWLLLLFLGPIGIVVIVVLWLFARGAPVSGFVPMTSEALARQNRALCLADWAFVVPILVLAAGVAVLAAPITTPGWLPDPGAAAVGLLLVALLGGVALMVTLSTIANRRRVSVVLDGSRRWVEIRNVHPAFAEATMQQVRARHRSARDGVRPGRDR